jgi:threonine dehydrogenase-like Zn-dependent dehydrogenase
MLALQKTRDDQGLELRDVPEPPPPGPADVRIRVAATGICGTDLGIQKWGAGYRAMMAKALPVTLGHETVGHVIAVGDGVTSVAIGDVVVVNPAVACGDCARCRAGDPVGCLDRRPVGMVMDGAFAPLLNVPESYVYRLPANIPLELGALVEPLSVAAYALDVAGFEPGQRALVYGPGPIGQGVAVLAREMGAAEVAVVGLSDAARFATLRTLGFDHLFDMSEPDAAERLSAFAGDGFDIAIEAAGVASVIDQALALLRPLGILAMAGMGAASGPLDIGLLVRKRLQVRGVSRIPPRIWPGVIALMAKRPEAFAPLITHRLPLSQAIEAFALCRAGETSKVLLIPGD